MIPDQYKKEVIKGKSHWIDRDSPVEIFISDFKKEIGDPKGAKVLQIEELITTLGTTTNIREAVEKGNLEPVEFLPIVGTLVHRPPKLPVTYNGLEVVSLVEKEVWAVDPAECPLCRQGSIRLKPKSHWAELTGK